MEEDKKLFVYWIGMVLGLTRQGRNMESCVLSQDERIVEITWKNKSVTRVDVACDSCMAILADIAKALM